MFIVPIIITLAYLQLGKSKTTPLNDIKLTSVLLSNPGLQQNHETEIENTKASIMKETLYNGNFLVDEIHKESDNSLMNRRAFRDDVLLENYPKEVNEKNIASAKKKLLLTSKSDNPSGILILIILSVLILTLISIVSFTVYSRNSQISIQLNSEVSKDEKKLRYSEVATEEQPIEVPNTDNNWRNTVVSKITSITRTLRSIGDLSTLRNTAGVGKSCTPSTHTLSSVSHQSIEMGSCINPPNEVNEKSLHMGKLKKKENTQTCQKTVSIAAKEAYDENLDTTKKMCPKCNHYRDPKMVIKKINDVEYKGGRIHIPIQLPVTLGPNKIKSVDFQKSFSRYSSTISAQKKCHGASCCLGTKYSRGSSSSDTSQQKEATAVACSSTSGKSKLNDELPSTSSTGYSQSEKNSFNVESCSLTGKSKENPSINSCSINYESESSTFVQNCESQVEDYDKTFSRCTSKTKSLIFNVSDVALKQNSSPYKMTEIEISEKHSNDEECQSAPLNQQFTISSVTCAMKPSPLTKSSCLFSANQLFPLDSSEMHTQSHSKPNPKKSKPKSTKANGENSSQSLVSSNLAYKAPVKFKVLSTDSNFDPTTLHVKQQLKILLNDNSNSKNPFTESNKDKLQPGQVIYADLCLVQKQSAAECANMNSYLVSVANKDLTISTKSVCSAASQKLSNVTSESESDPGYGASQTESTEGEDLCSYSCGKYSNCYSADKSNKEMGSSYCKSKICYDNPSHSNFTKKLSSRGGRCASGDATFKSALSSDSNRNLLQSLNQHLKGTYLHQMKGSSSSRFTSSSQCAPVLEYIVNDHNYDVNKPAEEQLGTGGQYIRNSMNKLLPKIKSYMSRCKKSSTSASEQVYEEPSYHEGIPELCENCLKHVPNDITKTIRSRTSLYSNVDKFKGGGTIHLNDLIELYPNLYPKLPSPIREALSKGFDELSASPYSNLCDNYEHVQERKWSELSASFENINYIN